jgi:ribosomal protein S18 acetylase RimI-like enzyme
MRASFRRVVGSEIDDAYATYLEVFEWLHAKGVRQWLRALSREAFVELQRRGELFAYYLDDRLAAVVMLAFENSSYWSEEIGVDRRWWIKSLAVARRCRGAGVGKRVMQESEALIRRAGAAEAFLDCVDAGFLPGYYTRLGYEELGRKDITYPSGNTFPMVLMRKNLPNQAPEPTAAAVTPAASAFGNLRRDKGAPGTPPSGAADI